MPGSVTPLPLPWMLVSALGWAYGGLALLSLAMDRHQPPLLGQGQSAHRRLRLWRAVGTAGLLLSLTGCLWAAGPTRGWVLWLGMLTAAALGVVAVHTWASRRALASAAVGLGAGVAFGVLAAWSWPDRPTPARMASYPITTTSLCADAGHARPATFPPA